MERLYLDQIRKAGMRAGKAAKMGDCKEIVNAANLILAIDESMRSWEQIAQRHGLEPETTTSETVEVDGEIFLSKVDASTYLGVTPKTIERKVAKGLVRQISNGKRNLYLQSDLLALREKKYPTTEDHSSAI